MRPRAGHTLALAFAVPALALAFLAPSAQADLAFCPQGSGAGQCGDPQGVAVDFETKRLYVVDQANNRVNVFEVDEGGAAMKFLFAFGWGVDTGANAFEKCTTASGCQAGLPGSGNGQFKEPRQVAVDNDPASLAHHDVYVFDSGNFRVQKFSPEGAFLGKAGSKGTGPGQFNDTVDLIAVGPGGVVHVSDMPQFEKEPRIEKFDSSLAFLDECDVAQEDRLNGGLAVNSAGNIYATFNASGGGIFKFEADCSKEIGTPLDPGAEAAALAIDAADNLYAKQGIGPYRIITKFDPAGNHLRRYGYGSLLTTTVSGIAPLSTSLGDVFASEQGAAVKYLAEPPPGPLTISTEADPGNTQATLGGRVNPEGKATSYHFEYATEAAYLKDKGEGGDGSEGAGAKSTPLTPLPGLADFELHDATAVIGCPNPVVEAEEPGEKCLLPETAYRFRIEATNADGKGNSPREGEFKTEPPLEVEDLWASEVGIDVARLSVTLNPLGVPATGFFEYVEEVAYLKDKGEGGDGFKEAIEVPAVGQGAGPFDFGAGKAGVTRAAGVALAPDTTYHLRVKAIDPLIKAPVISEERVFTTFEPEATEPCPANEAFRTGPSALLPDCRAYELVSPLDKEGGDIVAPPNLRFNEPATLNQSSVSGSKLAYGTYLAFGDAEAGSYTAQYIASRGPASWSSHYILGPREELDAPSLLTLYAEVKAFSPDLCEEWFRSAAEPALAPGAVKGRPNIYRRSDQECGEESYEALTTVAPPHSSFGYATMELQGVSADGTGAIYLSSDNLTADAPDLNGEGFALYYQTRGEGKPRYVCYLPDGTPIAGSCVGGTTSGITDGEGLIASVANALSADGQRVFWSDGTEGKGHIFVRLRPDQAQSKVSGGKCTQPTKACTIAVSAKGEELAGATNSRFWWAADDGSKAFFTTHKPSEPNTGDLYEFDVDTETTTLIAHKALGVMGASEDGSRLYFASEEALPTGPNSEGDTPVAGQANLYLRDGAGIRFVATLASTDGMAIHPFPARRTSRVAPDGLHAAFMSSGEPTGYESADAKSGQADIEVFLYDATANGGAGKLLCASCNPSGGRPAGKLLPTSLGLGELWMAARLPIWQDTLYPGRLLADDGSRLYFESIDSLVPRDANGATDIYQWEAPGSGGCDEADPDYSTRNEGCISLISSGQSAGNTLFIDASPSGNDVFFTTASSLLSQDYGLVDVYDARAGGGLPTPPTPAAECEGEACQAPAEAPEDPTPASAALKGAGNVKEGAAPRKSCPKGKVRVRRAGKSRCVKRKSAASRAKRRAERERRAGR
jgi:hypothetical protein